MSKQEHHKFLHCPISDCTYYGGDLPRHLKAKKHREDVDPLEANAIAQMVSKGKETKGSNRLLIRWCPVEGCSFLTPYLRNHLKNKHKIRNDIKLDDVMKMSLPYEPYKLPPSAATSIRIESDDDEDDDGDEEEDYPGEGAKAFYLSQRITSDRHWFLVKFYDHLGSIDEGLKDEKTRCQHACQMRKILEDMDPRGKDIAVIATEEGRAVWNLWVAPRLENQTSITAGTLMSYMGSFKKFLKFVVQTQKRRCLVDGTPRLSDETVDVLHEITGKLQGWRSIILKQSAVLRNEHYLQECEQRITREDLQAFLRSPVVAEAEALFGADGNRRGIQRFSRARDYLIARLAVSCGTRPKALETATLEHFKHARRDVNYPDCYVMLVPKHKRQMDGPAIVTMDERLHGFIDTYIREIRPAVVASPEETHLFLKIDGEPFEQGTIGNRVSELWRKSGVRKGARVTCTDFRKAIVTMVEEANKEERRKTGRECIADNDLRKLLAHSQKTAAIWYMREDLTSLGARTHTTIQRIREGIQQEDNGMHSMTTPSGTATSSTERESAPSREPSPPVSLPTPQPPMPVSPQTSEPPTIVFVPDPPHPSTMAIDATEVSVAPVSVLSSTSLPGVRRPRLRRRWPPEDTTLIVKYVESLNGRCPGKQEIYDAFHKSPEFISISKRENFDRFFHKVKTTFKALRQSRQLTS